MAEHVMWAADAHSVVGYVLIAALDERAHLGRKLARYFLAVLCCISARGRREGPIIQACLDGHGEADVLLEGVRRGSIAVLADGRLALALALAIGALLFPGGLRCGPAAMGIRGER